MYCKETPILLLGYDYKESIISYNAQKGLPSLKELGDVLTEQNRIAILDLMLEREEITIKDFELYRLHGLLSSDHDDARSHG